jgi:WXG100 family type VII secretion target
MARRESGVTSGVSQTKADAAVMRNTAAKFEQSNDSLQGMLKELMARLEGLETSWKGLGGQSFTDVKRLWAQNQAKLSVELAETARSIRESGSGYDATDNQAASRMASANQGLQLPL